MLQETQSLPERGMSYREREDALNRLVLKIEATSNEKLDRADILHMALDCFPDDHMETILDTLKRVPDKVEGLGLTKKAKILREMFSEKE